MILRAKKEIAISFLNNHDLINDHNNDGCKKLRITGCMNYGTETKNVKMNFDGRWSEEKFFGLN